MRPEDYLATVEVLLNAHDGRPSQADLRKALSATYYAVFYALGRNTADCFIGTLGAGISARAWRQAFRSIDHGFARRQCQNQQVMATFPPGIRMFANSFKVLQDLRHTADYDPDLQLSLNDVEAALNEATQAIAALAAVSQEARCDFAALVTLRDRR